MDTDSNVKPHSQQLVDHDDPYVGSQGQVSFRLRGDEHAHTYFGPIHSNVASVFGVDSGPFMEPDEWMSHVHAGEMYNRKVASANMRRYFALAEESAFGYEHPYAGGAGHLDYIVPGDEPRDEQDGATYRRVLGMVRASEKAKKALVRAYLLSYILTAQSRASHHVKQK